MATDLQHFTVSIPANTAQASPVTVRTVIPIGDVERIAWRIPSGSQGLMGFYFGQRGIQVEPTNAGAFIIGDGVEGHFDLTDLPDSGDWSVTGYNTGRFAHVIHVTYHWRPKHRARKHITLFTAAALSPAPDLCKQGAPVRRR